MSRRRTSPVAAAGHTRSKADRRAMIHRTAIESHHYRRPWQQELAEAIRDPRELLARLELPSDLLAGMEKASALFALRVPDSYLRRIRPADPDDPLLRQVLPLGAETRPSPGYHADPVGDLDSLAAPGVLHKYHGRVLLIATGACPVHCRYCFRRHYPYHSEHAGRDGWRPALAAIAADDSISEVILSGGDPLVLSDRKLSSLVGAIAEIPHVRRLRIHTRTPVVLPSRVDDELLHWLSAQRLQTVIVLHANHPQELDEAVALAARALRQAGATLLNQAVLLRTINDRAETLVRLSERLFEIGVLPYYLHLLDRVQGAAHFEVDDARAQALMLALRQRLPGYLVPRLVREQAGAPSKTPMA